ncbi:secreted antigen 1 [Babesia divergens]|uniref:Secreted antigen 1 n=1 Tax=Babesia divergens TaxID=32595 RepID=A0AAD9GD76_BABDI|nr:secreted antigen 1 [Babesia divergens]
MDFRMNISAIPRVVLLFCVALGTWGPSEVHCNDINTLISSREPSSLKDLFDFFGILGTLAAKNEIIETVERDVSKYFKPGGTPGKGIKGNILEVLENVDKFRKAILVNPSDYGNYSYVTESPINSRLWATAVINWLPILHREMWHIYHNSDKSCAKINDSMAAWADAEDGFIIDPCLALLMHLTDSTPFVGRCKLGYAMDELNSVPGMFVACNNTGIRLYGGGPLNHAQFGLFLSSTWHDSNLASVLQFIYAIVQTIRSCCAESAFHSDFFIHMAFGLGSASRALKTIMNNLQPLYDPRTAEERKTGKEGFANPYAGTLEHEQLEHYVAWLMKNLKHITASLKELREEKWASDDIEFDKSTGPFRYGFISKDWKWGPMMHGEITHAIDTLLNCSCSSLHIIFREISLTNICSRTEQKTFIDKLAAECTVLSYNLPVFVSDMLDFLGKLRSSDILPKVIKRVDDRITKYFNTSGTSEIEIQKNLIEVFDHVNKLREGILVNPSNFGNYSNLDESENCVDQYATAVINFLPILHAELGFLYNRNGAELLLVDGCERPDVSDSDTTLNPLEAFVIVYCCSPILLRSFKTHELKKKIDLNQFCRDISPSIRLGGCIGKAQFGLFLLQSYTFGIPTVASIALCMQEFCEQINKDDNGIFRGLVNDEKYDTIKSVCKTVARDLGTITANHSAFCNASLVSDEDTTEVTQIQNNMYKGKLKAECLQDYVSWMQNNLSEYIKCLEFLRQNLPYMEETFENLPVPGNSPGAMIVDRDAVHHFFSTLRRTLKTLYESFLEFFKSLRPSVPSASSNNTQAKPTSSSPSTSDVNKILRG